MSAAQPEVQGAEWVMDPFGEHGQMHYRVQHIPLLEPALHLEYATVFPLASIDEQEQRTDTVYLLHRGAGILTMNGVLRHLQETGLVLAPKGCRCAIANPSRKQNLLLFIIQLETPSDRLLPTFDIASLTVHLQEDAFHQTWLDQDRVLPRLAQIDLAQHFSGPWGDLTFVELPPGARVESYVLQDAYESLCLFAGLLTVVAGEQHINSDAGSGLYVLLSPGISRKIINRSSILPLLFCSLTIQEDQHGTSGDRTSHERI